MGKYFGTDGVRGIANKELTPRLAFLVGFYGAKKLKEEYELKGEKTNKKPFILIGRDTRISGTMLQASVAAGITSAGVDVVTLDIAPTASVAYLTKNKGALAGIVISASHNPAVDNGIKFIGADGFKLADEIEDAIEVNIENALENNLWGEENALIGKEVGEIHRQYQWVDEYMDYLKSYVAMDLKGINVVLDCANGAASPFAEKLFEHFGAEITPMNNKPNGMNINLAAGSTHLEGLRYGVLEHGGSIGIAFDGDADRMLAIDENGETVDGDQLIAIFAKYLKEKGLLENDLVAVTVMSNLGFEKAMNDLGIKVLRTQVGDRYVVQGLRENNGVLGGEQSGHIVFMNVNTTGDGFITALCLMKIISETKKPLSQLKKVMVKYPQVLHNVKVSNKEGFEGNEKIASVIKEAEDELNGKGRVLVRPSGTEALFRVMLEGEDQKQLEALATKIGNVIQEELA